MELRQLRFAVTLARTLNFRRTAEVEHITQSTVSAQIARLEREIGARLFDRDSRGVRLTEAGRVFVEQAERTLTELADTARGVRDLAGASRGRLVIGVFAEGLAELTPTVVAAFRRAAPEVSLAFVELTIGTHVRALADGDVDVAVVRPPVFEPSFVVRELFREPRLAAVGTQHPLAQRESVSVADLLDEPVVTTVPQRWGTFWSCDDQRGRVGRTAGVATSVAESLDCVAYLGAVDTLPASSARYYRHPGVRYLPVSDVPDATAAVARRRSDHRAVTAAFCRTAEYVAGRHLDLVPGAVAAAR